MSSEPLVHVRTPTFKRPVMLKRALECLLAQTHQNWVCDVFDDDREESARAVVEAIGDPRIHYSVNAEQKYGSKNIDDCFSRENPRDADYFCVLEDDNLFFPEHFEKSIKICETKGVDLVFRNQLIEHNFDTPDAYFSEAGMLDDQFAEGVIAPDDFRLCMFCGIGVSNGGLFWSRNIKTDLAIGFPISSTLQEYFRTYMIKDDIYIAMEPLASWAENGKETLRYLGETAKYLRREFDLKRSVQYLQRRSWQAARPEAREAFLNGSLFHYSKEARAAGMAKSLLRFMPKGISFAQGLNLFARGWLIRLAGRLNDDFREAADKLA